MNGKIFNIQRFSTSDGPGIRTVVFLKGCPLSCVWCHNPESKSNFPEIFYNPMKCMNCRICEKECSNNQHIFSDSHIFLRDSCEKCGKCTLLCPTGALEICGKDITDEEVINEVLRDKDFYMQSGGGITLSGGEPLMQYEFSLEILKKSKEAGLHTAIETSGYRLNGVSEISRYTDLWLYDIKLISENEHIKYTGVSNKIIMENLFFLDSIGADIILRCPLIPEINLKEEHFDGIADIVNNLKNIKAINFELYHPLGIDKAIRIGKEQEYKNASFLSSDMTEQYIDYIKTKTNVNDLKKN